MQKTKEFKPYTGDKCTLKTTGAGCYLIRKGSKIVYVGYSGTDLKKTMYRHFQTWNDPTQQRVVYKQLNEITCRVIFTDTAKRAQLLEEALILKYKPRDNAQKLEMYSQKAKNTILEEVINLPEVAPF